MKKILILFSVLFLFSNVTVLAQDPIHKNPDRAAEMSKIKALKVGYITDEVGLTPSESEKFWPLYNQYWQDKKAGGHKMRDLCMKVEGGTAGDADLVQFLYLRQLDVDNMNKWSEKFKSVLSPSKVLKVFVAEENFKRFLLKQNIKNKQ